MILPPPPYTGHPLLASLDALVSRSEAVLTDCQLIHRKLLDAEKAVDPTRLAGEIESMLGKPDELKSQRRAYREALIRFESLCLAYSDARSRLGDITLEICDATTAVYAHIDEQVRDRKFSEAERLLWMIAATRGADQHRAQPPHFYLGAHTKAYLPTQTMQALRSAFTELVAFNQGRSWANSARKPLSYTAPALSLTYTTELVVAPLTVRPYEMRSVTAVPFKAFHDSEFPAGRMLADLLEQLKSAIAQLDCGVAFLKQNEKGRINERQYAERLVQQVLVDSAAEAAVEQVAAQMIARNQYETTRAAVFTALVRAEDLHAQLVGALLKALVECQALDHFVSTEKVVTVDKFETHRISLNNCLAADLLLRNSGRKLAAAVAEFKEDLSFGHGQTAIYRRFGEFSEYYAGMRRSQLAQAERDKTPTANGSDD